MTTNRSIAAALAALSLSACGASSESAPDTAMASEAVPARGETGPEGPPAIAECRFDPAAVDIRFESTGDGAAIVFTPKGGRASELQGDVETFQRTLPGQLPASERSGEADLGPHENEEAGTGTTNQQAGVDTEAVAVETRTEVVDGGGGVRIILTPRDPLHLTMVRDYARRRAEELAGAECGSSAPAR